MKKNLKCMECVWSEGRSPSHRDRRSPNWLISCIGSYTTNYELNTLNVVYSM